jgi:hypothetical protein
MNNRISVLIIADFLDRLPAIACAKIAKLSRC